MSKDEGNGVAAPTTPASGSTEKSEEILFNIGDVINGYKIVKKIDEGGFGQVFKVTKDEKTFYAMKLELNSQEGGSAIKLEIHVLSQLPKNSIFPAMLCGGRKAKFSYLVLELLGDSLKMLKNRCPNPDCLSDGTWSRIGIQCLFALKTMHDRGFVHRDVKPSNFAIGLNSPTENRCRMILLFDFGLARKFVKTEHVQKDNSKNNNKGSNKNQNNRPPQKTKSKIEHAEPPKNDLKKLIPPSKTSSVKCQIVTKTIFRLARAHTEFRGTQQYASPNAHLQLELGRHDDIWSLMYMIAEFFLELPWTNNDDLPVEVLKDQSPLLRLFTDEKNLSHFTNEQYQKVKEIDKMLKDSNYYSHPNYEMIHDFLKEIMTKSKVSWDSPYDWEPAGNKSSKEGNKNSNKKNVDEKKFLWMDPGPFFKEDKWASLDKPVLKSSGSVKPPKKKVVQVQKKRGKKNDTNCMSNEDSFNIDSMKKDTSGTATVESKKEVENKSK